MGRRQKQSAIAIFEGNVADAEQLLALARSLDNQRVRRMRRELRHAFGAAMRISKKEHEGLDCVESEDLFVVIKTRGSLTRADFTEQSLRPLPRQSIVSVAAAVEAYVAEKAASFISDALDESSPRVRAISVTLGDVFEIEETLTRRRYGWRRILQDKIERDASAAPGKIDSVFNLVGKSVPWSKIDSRRGVPKEASRKQMEELAKRRNGIAHGERANANRATVPIEEAEAHLSNAKSVIEAIDALL